MQAGYQPRPQEGGQQALFSAAAGRNVRHRQEVSDYRPDYVNKQQNSLAGPAFARGHQSQLALGQEKSPIAFRRDLHHLRKLNEESKSRSRSPMPNEAQS